MPPAAVIAAILALLCVMCRSTEISAEDDDTSATYGSMLGARAKCYEKVCLEELGCFKITDDFCTYPQWRPENKLPEDRKTIGTTFQLYTRRNRQVSQKLKASDIEGLKKSNFNKAHSTIIISHGFRGSCDGSKFMKRTRDEFLKLGEFNVILVDWRDGCSNILGYEQATANARVVGAEIALLINKLNESHQYTPEKCHIVGHSLGSHVAGYAGKRLNKLGRITGLDPAGPAFANMPATVRLDKQDALFVDVIHTDIQQQMKLPFTPLGISEPIGHMDFYPTGGSNQPGCSMLMYEESYFNTSSPISYGGWMSCNHNRAPKLFANSINPKGPVGVAYRCASWDEYRKGACGSCGSDASDCSFIGYNAIKSFKPRVTKTQSFYIETGPSEPFWLYQYQVAVVLSSQSTQKTGKLKVRLVENKNRYIEMVTKTLTLKPRVSYRMLASVRTAGLEFQYAELSWGSVSYHLDPFKPFLMEAAAGHEIKVDKIEVLPMSVIDLKVQSRGTKKFCYMQPIPIQKVVKFTKC